MPGADWLLVAGLILVAAGAWVGHAYLLTALLNILYALPLPKLVLKPWRLLTGLTILGGPWLLLSASQLDFVDRPFGVNGWWGWTVLGYAAVCTAVGLVWFPLVTVYRARRPTPKAVLAEHMETVDFGRDLGPAAVGDGKFAWLVPRLPTDIFRVDFTAVTLAVPRLPAEWDGLTVLLLSDLHFHGTPSRAWFDRVFDRLAADPPADLVVVAGDVLDTDTHHAWIGPLLGRLRWAEHGLAIVGNHDAYHDPDRVRKELSAAGYRVLSGRWEEVTVRGVRCVVSGHEGPWIGSAPDLSAAPTDVFHLCVSHTPDHFYWGVRSGVDLMLCGHVHGGQIRLPLVGSIFVPSVYGRRFDMGVFERGDTVMAVSRGVSGKEPLRWRCRPQVMRLTLRRV